MTGIEKERQRTFYSVIALRRTQIYETGSRIDYLAPEVVRRFYLLQHLPLTDDGYVSGMQFKITSVETITARSSQTEQMSQILLLAIRPHDAEPVCDDYIFLIFHALSVYPQIQK